MDDETVTFRFFNLKKASPVHVELDRLRAMKVSAHPILKAFTEQRGVEIYGTAPENYQFTMSKGRANPAEWSRIPQSKKYRPKKTTPEGKALLAEVMALPVYPNLQDAVKVIPNIEAHMMIFNAPYLEYAGIYYAHKDTVIIRVPQASDVFKPPSWMKEIKEWEAMKIKDAT